MTIETLKSPNSRNRSSISVIKSNFLSVSSMNTLLAILKVTDARRDVILAGGLYHISLETPPPSPSPLQQPVGMFFETLWLYVIVCVLQSWVMGHLIRMELIIANQYI